MPVVAESPTRILPDPKFGIVELSKFMNVIMESGKKAVAERIIYGALEQVEKKAGQGSARDLHHRAEQHQADGRGQVTPRRRCELPGSRGSSPRTPRRAGDALAQGIGAQARREVDGAALWPTSCSRRAKAGVVR